MRVYWVTKHDDEAPVFFGGDEESAKDGATAIGGFWCAFENGQQVEQAEGTPFLVKKQCFTAERKRQESVG